ncbi:MAG: CRISPR-associated protein Csx16 [Coriobacteriia bacterium]|nr:CRISPR-associated protein Csx16 [Coriobacteriia bacterium]
MTVWLVSRHPAAVEWVMEQGVPVDRVAEHLTAGMVVEGDTVIGALPVHLAADICDRRARYVHLALDVPAGQRGAELTVDDMREYGARLTEYHVSPVGPLGPTWPPGR